MARRKAGDDKVTIGDITDVSGEVNVAAGDIYKGYTAEQVSILLTQITTTLQPKPFDGRCPYKGLEVFEEEDADLFFGRERLVEDLLSRVRESRAVFITGPSGSGKSSLVRAGLIHALKQGQIKNSDRWLYETMKPGREPLAELARATSSFAGTLLAGQNIRTIGRNDATVLAQWCEIALRDQREKHALLFIDQFEEVFTQIADEAERLAFLNLLTHAGTVENGRLILLFAMRSDFVSNCATYPELNSLLNQQFIQIGSMQPDELVSAIAQPALRVGLRIDPNLIAQIINDMRGEPGALPLMQFALKDLFDSQQAQGKLIALMLEDYFTHGGIHKSLERHADNAFTKLSEGEKELAHSIFSGLIEIGRGTQDTRRTALFDELVPGNANPADVKVLVQKLADERLIITDEQAGKDTVTISHEKLIDAWPWLKRLVNENREVIGLQNEIRTDAKEWADHNRDASYVYTGARLTNVRELLEIKKLVLSGVAREFVQAGITRQRRAQVISVGAISLVVLLLMIAVVVFSRQASMNALLADQKAEIADTAQAVSTFAIAQQVTAQANADEARRLASIALARQLAAQSQILDLNSGTPAIESGLLAVEAARRGVGLEADQALRRYLTVPGLPLLTMRHEKDINSVAVSLDGKYIVSASDDKTARVWEIATGKEIARMAHDGPVNFAAFSPDGKYVVSGSADKTVRVWEAGTGREISRMTHDDLVTTVAFSPDGKYVVSGSADKTVRLWEATTGTEVARMTHDGRINCLAFSSDGKYVASGSDDGTARVWEANTGKEISRMTHDLVVLSVVFSPDGKYVASASADRTARVWDATSGQEIARMTHDDPVYTVAFSPDGKYVVSGSFDNTIRVWEAATGREVTHISHTGRIVSVIFTPDGRYIVSAGSDGTARMWEAATGKEIARMTHDSLVVSVAYVPGSQLIVSGSADGTVRVWEPSIGQEIAHLTHDDLIRAAAISPDGRYIVSVSNDRTARVWNPANGQEIARIPYGQRVISVAISPDSSYVALGTSSGSIHVLEIATGKEISSMKQDANVWSVAFSPDGKHIISGSFDHTARVWESRTGTEVARMTHGDVVYTVAFSPDGKYVMSGGCEKVNSNGDCSQGSARVWEAKTGKEIARMTHADNVVSVAFSPDGKYVVSGSWDGTARVWETVTGKEVARMTHNGLVASVVFSSDGKYVASAGGNNAELWDALTGKEILHMHHATGVRLVAFSPDGKYMITGDYDGAAHVWEVGTGKEIVRVKHEDGSIVNAVAFSPDGTYAMSAAGDTIHLWYWQIEKLIAEACKRLPRNLTRTEWLQYIGSEPYRATCPNLPLEPEGIATSSPTP